MCGILGSISKQKNANFAKALSLLNKRGPDNQTIKSKKIKNFHIQTGHTRLKILDLSNKANQPMLYKNLQIVFNGEIYNFKDLKEEIKNEYKFNTTSDTEVLVKYIHKNGIEKSLNKLRGMYSFALLDSKQNKIYLVRDQFGIKPLFYYLSKDTLIFSSEVKSILELLNEKQTLNKNAFGHFFLHRYILEPETTYTEIKVLESAHYLKIKIDKDLTCQKISYWQLQKRNIHKNESEIINKIEELLHNSVKRHLISDRPLAFCLSGGLDSSLLLAIAKKHKKDLVAYTIKRSSKDIDYIYSNKVSKHLKINKIDISSTHISPIEVKKLLKYYDQPIACSSIFSYYILFREISKTYPVTISGDGADEIFGGYLWHQKILNYIKFLEGKIKLNISLKWNIKYFLDHIKNKNIPLLYKRSIIDRYNQKEKHTIERILKIKLNEKTYYQEVNKNTSLKDLSFIDFHTFLKFTLLRVDYSSMIHSVENRVPYLDIDLVNYVYDIDSRLFYQNSNLKYLLKKVAARYFPKDIIERKKFGFTIDLKKILPINNSKEAMNYLLYKWVQNNKKRIKQEDQLLLTRCIESIN